MPNSQEGEDDEVQLGTATLHSDHVDDIQSCIEVANPGYSEGDAVTTISEDVNTLVDSLPGLVRALDEVANLHPFIGIAVNAFRIVIELNMKRRNNDKKIDVLFVEMRDMMEVLLLLREVDGEIVGPDGLTIKTRMEELVKRTTEDIKTCANACDTYMKKKLIVKVIHGPVWEGTLRGFIELFANRHKEFIFALSIHRIICNVLDVDRKLKEIDARICIVLNFFSKVESPEQQELSELIRKKGGLAVVMENNDALKDLLQFQPATSIDQANRDKGPSNNSDEDDLAIMKQELFESPVLAIKKNLEVFERKFEIQAKVLMEGLRRVIHHEGDRVIEAVTSGPRDRIIDPNIHEVWKDMRWLEHVKASHFVLALCDYYRRDVRWESDINQSGVALRLASQDDEWASQWINVNRLQAVVEAFDDDASGFINVAEVNHFTTSRPEGWRLPRWLAFWAIGWEMAATNYRDLIDDICAKMFAIRFRIRLENRNAVDRYLHTVWMKICTLTSSLVGMSWDKSLRERFQDYIEAEEERLREALEIVKYHIDSMDTLLLVIGPGQIEKRLFPLLWLLLRRHFEIFRLCQHTIINKNELWHSADTLNWIFDAVTKRHDDLEDVFIQQNMHPGVRFKIFSSEVLNLWHDSSQFWSLDNLRTLEFSEVEYDDSKEDQNIDGSELLIYNSAVSDLYPPRMEDPVTEDDAAADEVVRAILGRWNGFQFSEGQTTWPMITFCLHASMDSMYEFEAHSADANGTDYNIVGDCMPRDDGVVEYLFTQTYVARNPQRYWTGTLEDDGNTLTGRWGYDKDNQSATFIFKRVPPEVLINRPHPKHFAKNKASALWKYAVSAVHNRVRQRWFSWSYLKARRDVRTEYMELLLKEANDMLTDGDLERFSVLNCQLTFDDVRSFYIIRDYGLRAVPTHFGITCDYCGDPISNTRVVCMECGSRGTFDFCDKPECVGCTIRTRDDISSPHVPTHDVVKIRAPILHYREIGKVLRSAKAGLERAKDLFEDAEDQRRRRGFINSDYEDTETRGRNRDTKDSEGSEGSARALSEEDKVDDFICLRCGVAVAKPCFYCIDCPEDMKPFICWDCDQQQAGFSYWPYHLRTHNLVRCMEREEGRKPEENRAVTLKPVGPLEDKLETTDEIAGLKSQMDVLTSQMERIEKLLRSLPHAHGE